MELNDEKNRILNDDFKIAFCKPLIFHRMILKTGAVQSQAQYWVSQLSFGNFFVTTQPPFVASNTRNHLVDTRALSLFIQAGSSGNFVYIHMCRGRLKNCMYYDTTNGKREHAMSLDEWKQNNESTTECREEYTKAHTSHIIDEKTRATATKTTHYCDNDNDDEDNNERCVAAAQEPHKMSEQKMKIYVYIKKHTAK